MLDFPGASQTTVTAISGNNIIGGYGGGAGSAHSFLYDGSTWTTLDVPGATSTWAYDVSGDNVVGYYYSDGTQYSFLYNGVDYITLNPPGAVSSTALAVSGNDIVGQYQTVATIIAVTCITIRPTPRLTSPAQRRHLPTMFPVETSWEPMRRPLQYLAHTMLSCTMVWTTRYLTPTLIPTVRCDSSSVDAVSGEYVLGHSLDSLLVLAVRGRTGCTMVRATRRSAFPGPFIQKPGMYPATMSSDTIQTVPVSIMVSCTKSSRNLRHSFSSARRSRVGWCSS